MTADVANFLWAPPYLKRHGNCFLSILFKIMFLCVVMMMKMLQYILKQEDIPQDLGANKLQRVIDNLEKSTK